MDIEGRGLSGVDEGIISEGEYLQEFASEKEIQAVFDEAFLTTQEDVLWSIDRRIKMYTEQANGLISQDASYLYAKIRLLERFKQQVKNTVFFEKLEPLWSYTYIIQESGVVLELDHCRDLEFTPEGYPMKTWVDQTFVIAEAKSKLLTVEEYAEQSEVETGTVRQWIRRGKIRSALKVGNEWRIPELAEPRQREYSMGRYKWDSPLNGLPEGYEFINDYRSVNIMKDKDSKSIYTVTFYPGTDAKNMDAMSIKLILKDKEKLELFFIGNPLVKYMSGVVEVIVD